jgi:hypothetical protein
MMFPFSTCMCFRQNQIWTVIPQQFEAATNKVTDIGKTEEMQISMSADEDYRPAADHKYFLVRRKY